MTFSMICMCEGSPAAAKRDSTFLPKPSTSALHLSRVARLPRPRSPRLRAYLPLLLSAADRPKSDQARIATIHVLPGSRDQCHTLDTALSATAPSVHARLLCCIAIWQYQ
jgi:hypothetical protein